MSDAEPTVFVVDDDPSIRRSTERLVRSLGFNVQTFGSAKEFIGRGRVDGPSCLVLDVHLPGVGAASTCSASSAQAGRRSRSSSSPAAAAFRCRCAR